MPEAPIMCTAGRKESVDEIVSAGARLAGSNRATSRGAAEKDEVFIDSSDPRIFARKVPETKTPRRRRGVFETVRTNRLLRGGRSSCRGGGAGRGGRAGRGSLGGHAGRARGRRLGLFDDLGRLDLDFGLPFLGLAAGHERRCEGDEGEGGRELLHFGVLLNVRSIRSFGGLSDRKSSDSRDVFQKHKHRSDGSYRLELPRKDTGIAPSVKPMNELARPREIRPAC